MGPFQTAWLEKESTPAKAPYAGPGSAG